MSDGMIHVTLQQQAEYQFDIAFGGDVPHILADEPPPLGASKGPSPVQLLSAAVGNCLSDSLYFALRKWKQSPEPIRCEVTAQVGRNEQNRLRVLHMRADLHLGVNADQLQHLDRVLPTFEQFCTVTQSVAGAIPVETHVFDAAGVQLK